MPDIPIGAGDAIKTRDENTCHHGALAIVEGDKKQYEKSFITCVGMG